MAIGRISGPLLKENLLREGQNLRFENDLLVLKVDEEDPADHRIGIKTANPGYTLDISGTTRSTTIRAGKLIVDDVDVDGSTISSTLGNLTFEAATATDSIVSKSDFLPDLTDQYELGSTSNRWLGGYFKDIFVNGISIGTSGGSVDLITDEVDKIYVQLNGSDTEGDGTNLAAAYRTIKHALSQATSGQTVVISPGVYVEEFPLTVPQGVQITGAGLRSTTIEPTIATKNKDCFLLNGETTVQELTVKDMFYDSVNNTGYAFRFAPGCIVAQRSPYIQRVTVLNKGSTITASDPYGFTSADAGRGALLDGAVVSRNSLEAAILFNECTFIVPNSRALVMTNGARTEWLNCFTYFANLAIEGVVGATGRGGDGKTYLELENITGTFNAGNTISYYDIDGVTLITSAVIESVVGNTLVIDGSAAGFSIATNRPTKVVTASGDAVISTVQKKFGAASLLLDGTGDYIRVAGDNDFAFSTGDFTLETFFYRNVTAGTQVIFDFRSGSTVNNPYVYASGTSLIYGANNSPQINVAGALPSTGTWYHVAAVRASGTVKLYVNGVQVGGSYVDLNDYAYPVNVYIGANYVGSGGVNGYLDEIRISKGFARYTATPFAVPTSAFFNDQYTSVLLHLNTNLDDDGGAVQDIRSSSGGTATKVVRYDRKEFAAEMRSISGANVYGNQGVKADGADVVLQLMAHNFAYIGTGANLTNDAAGVVQEDEVIELNSGKVYYSSVDQRGDFRVGNYFRVNSETGAVSFNVPNFNVSSLSGITFTDGTNTTIVNPTGISTGNLIFAGNTISTATGPIILDPSGSNIVTINADTDLNGLLTVNSDIAVNGGDITTNQTTFNLINATATTVNFAGAATTIEIGAATGTTNINNNLDVDGDVNIDGGDLTVSTTTFNLANTAATTGNLFGAATTINIGAAGSTGTLTVKNDNVVLDGDLQVKGGDLTTNQTTFNLLNTTVGTVNAFGAATVISVGANTSTVTLNNDLTVKRNVSIEGTNLTTTQTSFNLLDGTATTVQAFGAAETLVFASSTGTTTFRSDVVINKDLQVKGGDITTNSSTFNLINDTATTVNFAGAATALNLSRVGGTTTVLGDLQVDGNAEITGDLTIGGNLTLGNQDTDSITVAADFTSSLIPDTPSTYNLGAVGKEWDTLYADTAVVTELSNGVIKLSSNTIEILTTNTDLILEPNGTGRVVLNTTTAIQIPVGTAAQRPTPANIGDIRLNTDTDRVENYNGEQWNTMTNEDDAIAFAIALG